FPNGGHQACAILSFSDMVKSSPSEKIKKTQASLKTGKLYCGPENLLKGPNRKKSKWKKQF
ncbi:MAG: hypothetical protein PQJ60_06525, partial [Spirochaetales bacterium]|nr:hypothetical protein [Spirochaetales bacterium]